MSVEMASNRFRFLVTIVPLLLFLTPTRIASREDIVSGAVPFREPSNEYPIMYSSVVPLLYKFMMPVWDVHSLKIQFWKEHNNCTEDDKYSSGYPCPILFHMHPIVEQFLRNMTTYLNLFADGGLDPEITGEFLEDPSILWDKDVCSKLRLEPHFKAAKTSSQHMDRYIQVMLQCAQMNGTNFNSKVIRMDKLPSYLEELYHMTFMSFTADYWHLLETDIAREAASLLGWTALQMGLMNHQNMEAQKWNQAVETCRNSRIPWTIITKDSLREQLSILRTYLAAESKDLSIPTQEVHKYFQLPLTDCIFGEDGSFLVRIMVPVVPKEAAEKNYFVRFHPVPFAAQGKICSVWEGGESFAFHMGLNGLLPTDCDKSNTFCKGWDNPPHDYESSVLHRFREKCILAIAADSEDEVVQECPLHCRDTTAERFNLEKMKLTIHKSDTTLIQIIPSSPFPNVFPMIKCRSKKSFPLILRKEGAYEITYPADQNCTIVMSHKSNSTSMQLLNSDLVQIDHLMPYHWRHGVVTSEGDDEDIHELSTMDEVEMLNGAESKINFLANRLQELDQYCREGADSDSSWLWIFVIFSILTNIVMGFVVAHLFLWKTKQVNDSNRFNLLANAADFPISDAAE